MKQILTILITIFSVSIASARFGGCHSSSHSSSHSSGHTSTHSSSHTTPHHISSGKATSTSKTQVRTYHEVSHVRSNDIHVYPSNHTFTYYYLLMNHNTHSYDTIQANSVDDLNTQVNEISSEDDSPWTTGELLFLLFGIACLIGLIVLATR